MHPSWLPILKERFYLCILLSNDKGRGGKSLGTGIPFVAVQMSWGSNLIDNLSTRRII
jgi:hypothetical protein